MWFELDINVRNQIKNALMITLITKIVIARRAAASAIASICGLELPLKQWPQIIPVLTNNSSNVDSEVKKAALMTLGFICEELVRILAFYSYYHHYLIFIIKKNTGNPNCLEQDQIEIILMGILIGMVETETNHEIREFSIKACHDSLNFMETLLQRKVIYHIFLFTQ